MSVNTPNLSARFDSKTENPKAAPHLRLVSETLPFIWAFTIDPPGLRGLNRLAIELNAAEAEGSIKGWNLGRWLNKERTLFTILFFNAHDMQAARSSVR